MEDLTERLNEELESRRKMADKLTHERHKNQKETACTQEVRREADASTGAAMSYQVKWQ